MVDFSEAQIQAVWDKASTVPGNEPNVFRKDRCTAWIARADYGNRNLAYGWEIDHITPVSKGGSDLLYNLQPLHWENNAAKADVPLVCSMISSGTDNIKS